MNILSEIDFNDYSEHWKKELRLASRAIIEIGDKIVLVRSDKYGEYKFPGGGLKTNETIYEALVRETYEETGLEVDEKTISEFGATFERRKKFGDNVILYQLSFYYKCSVTSKNSPPSLDAFEKELGYKMVLETPIIALEKNRTNFFNINTPWVQRDSFILSLLCETP